MTSIHRRRCYALPRGAPDAGIIGGPPRPASPGPGNRGRRRLVRRRSGCGGRAGPQWWQAPGLPVESAVRNEEPQPQAATAFGLLTVKPAPMSVST